MIDSPWLYASLVGFSCRGSSPGVGLAAVALPSPLEPARPHLTHDQVVAFLNSQTIGMRADVHDQRDFYHQRLQRIAFAFAAGEVLAAVVFTALALALFFLLA